MFFNSWEYFIFLPVVLLFNYSLNHRWQNYLLLAASYFFYSWWDWRFTALLVISTVVDFYLGLAIHRAQEPHQRKRWLLVSCVVNFGMLGFFKYFNFFADSAAHLLQTLGLQAHPFVLQIILPAGISFYTFQTMNYVIDIYRREMEPTRNILTYAAFVAYFPHLVAGPIIRAELLLPQLEKERVVDNLKFRGGCLLILIGLFKKVVIADSLAPDVTPYFTTPAAFSSLALLKGLYYFSLQIYCDFSGYTDIARGTSRLLGIELPENFNQPYLSQTITEFWRRWHISLSSWLRDYLYIPLGGNRKGRFRTYANLMLTMVLGGLWHGANWTFVVWGFLHGLYLAVHKFILELRPSNTGLRSPVSGLRSPVSSLRSSWLPPTALRVVKIIITFHLVCLTWIFFRAVNFSTAFAYLIGIIQWHGGFPVATIAKPLFWILLVLALDLPQDQAKSHTVILRWPWLLRGAAYAGMVFALAMSRTEHAIPFIYFQF